VKYKSINSKKSIENYKQQNNDKPTSNFLCIFIISVKFLIRENFKIYEMRRCKYLISVIKAGKIKEKLDTMNNTKRKT